MKHVIALNCSMTRIHQTIVPSSKTETFTFVIKNTKKNKNESLFIFSKLLAVFVRLIMIRSVVDIKSNQTLVMVAITIIVKVLNKSNHITFFQPKLGFVRRNSLLLIWHKIVKIFAEAVTGR